MLAALAVMGIAGTPALAQQDVVIGSSSVGGSYYLYAGGLSTYLTEKNPKVKATARTTRGSVENVRLLDRGTLDFGFANGTVIAQHKSGDGQFKDAKSDKIRGIAVVDLSPTHFVTLKSSKIMKLQDLKGVRMSIGAAGSGGANTAMIVLDALGIRKDVRIQNLGFSESANNLRDGNLEAFSGGSALPMPAVVDLSTTHDIRLLSFDDKLMAELQSREPAMEVAIIPPKTYRGIDEPIQTIGNPSTMITHAGMSEEAVYEITKTMLSDDNKKYMRSIYKAWDPAPGLELWKRIGVPLHPGAERAYREAGILK